MMRIVATVLALGVAFAAPARADDMMKKDKMGMQKKEKMAKKKPMHKDSMGMQKKDSMGMKKEGR